MQTVSSPRLLTCAVAVLVLVLVAAGPGLAQEKPAQEKPAAKTLYERIGGYDGIAKIVDDFVPRLAADPQLKRFFGGLAAASRKRNRQLVIEQICEAAGGPCTYIGRPMAAAHQGLGITQADFEIAGKHFGETLEKLKIGQAEGEELGAIINKLRDDIVDKTPPTGDKPPAAAAKPPASEGK